MTTPIHPSEDPMNVAGVVLPYVPRSAPDAATSELWDVEMQGKIGHTCHVFIPAATGWQADKLAAQYFPELEATGNTRLDKPAPPADIYVEEDATGLLWDANGNVVGKWEVR